MISNLVRQSVPSLSRNGLPVFKAGITCNYFVRSLHLSRELVLLRSSRCAVRFQSTRPERRNQNHQLEKTNIKSRDITKGDTSKSTVPNYSPLAPLSKMEVAKITETEVGSINLDISERDLLEIDSFSRKLFDMVETPFDESLVLQLKEINVNKLFNRVKDTLHVNNVPATVKAIRVLSSQDRVDDALFLWNVLQKHPHGRSLLSWTAYLNTLCTHNRSAEAKIAIKDMILGGIIPDSHVYGILINGLVKEGKLEDAYSVASDMMAAGIRPNNVIFSSLIYGCVKTRQMSRADETFDLMRNYVEEPDAITIALMIRVAEMQKNTERAMTLFGSLDVHNQTPTQGCYHAIIHACAHSWRYDVIAFDYFTMMKKAGFAPSLTSYHLLLEACVTSGDFCKANDVLVELQENGLKPTVDTYSLMVRVLAEGAGRGLAMPEHPAGQCRFTREEYKKQVEGYSEKIEKDRLSYVRDLRTKSVDDGLEEDTEQMKKQMEINANNPEREVDTKTDLDSMFARSGEKAREFDKKQAMQQQNLQKRISDSTVDTTVKRGRTGGLSEAETTAEIQRIEQSMKTPSGEQISVPLDEHSAVDGKGELTPTMKSMVEKIVRERYTLDELTPMPRLGDNNKDMSMKGLDDLEKRGRVRVEALFERKGGDVKHIDYRDPLWHQCVDEIVAGDTKLKGEIDAMMKTKMGMTVLMGADLIDQKQDADVALLKEIDFLRSCFLEDPKTAKQMTQLRLAKEIDSTILNKYDILGGVEPNAVYKRTTDLVCLTLPNRVRDLQDYWERLFAEDMTVPPLKKYLVEQGEIMWKKVCELTENKPNLVNMNGYLKLYANALYLHRADAIFNSFKQYDLTADTYSYHTMVSMYCKSKRLPQAAQMMRDMQLAGMTPAPETYGEMIIALTRVGSVDKALAVLTDIKRQNLPYPKERYLRPLRMALNKLNMSDHPSLPEDKEKKWRESYHNAVRKDSIRGNSAVKHAFNAQ